jgi:D-alanyl-lipoteichoic acid acyltransferase DltB (MBOAT superfamily)
VNVPSIEFVLFGAAVALAFHLSRDQNWRQVVFLVANLGFFITFVPNFLAALPYAGFLTLGYVGTFRANLAVARWSIVAAIILSFFWLKRYSFIPDFLTLPFPYVTIGLSYVFFRILHVAIDAQQQDLKAAPRLVSYLNYVLNFTSLVSGPIQRIEDYRQVEKGPSDIDARSFGQSLERVVIGFFKVFVLSSALSTWQQQLLDAAFQTNVFLDQLIYGTAVVALYPVYLYCNFSGYTDVVIGVARWFGLYLPENFNRPFQAESFIVFWNRWHITLSSWLRTYVFQPLLLSLMNKMPSRWIEPYLAAFAMFVTFFLVGAWHGQTTAFLFYGVLQGLGVSANALYQTFMTKRLGKAAYARFRENMFYRNVARGLTFTWFSFTLLWFWSDWDKLAESSAQLGAAVTVLIWPVLLVSSTLVLGIWFLVFNWSLSVVERRGQFLMSRYARTMFGTALFAITVSTTMLLNSASPPIVYKNF